MLDEIATFLNGEGIGVFDAVGTTGNIFICQLPDAPDEVIAIYPTGGPGTDSKQPVDMPTVQILVRGRQDPRSAQETAQAIYDALNGLANTRLVVDGTLVIGCHAVQSAPAWIGRDDSGRGEFSLNFQLTIHNDNRRA